MNNKYQIKDILEAIDILLDNKNKKNYEFKNNIKEPLKLTNMISEPKRKNGEIPHDTEEIILQAEKYLNK